ncbi:MAG: methylenetetrahydrofolate reductase [Steroidobacteraceae bacterium]
MSRLAEGIRAGRFVVTSELTPPKGVDIQDLLARAEALRNHVDAFNLTESPRARMAVEPKSVGRMLLERGIEPIVQITARDRNRIAIQADMLGAALLGIENLLVMRGDPPNKGDHPEAKPVYDLDAVEMLRAARYLNQGQDLSGSELRGTPRLFVGATVNPGAPDMYAEIANVRSKIEAGAQFLQTQGIYDATALERFLTAARIDGVPLLAGIIPLKSVKMAAWLNANVPGIRVPEVLLKEMDAAGAQQRETEAGIQIAARLVSALRPMCAGVHIMALGWEAHIPQILTYSRAM